MSKLKFNPQASEEDRTSALRVEASLSDTKTLNRNYSSFGARKIEDSPSGPVLEFIAVSEGKKRDGSTIQVKGIDLTAIKSNPVWMWAHNYSLPPIGRIVDFRKSTVEGLGKVLKVRVAPLRSQTETEHTKFADGIWAMYLNGDLRTVSFGWRTVEADPLKDENGYHTGWDFKRTDAMEISGVPIPADPDALITNIQMRGLDASKFVTQRNAAGIYELREAIPEGFDLLVAKEVEEEDVEIRATDPIVPQTTPPANPEVALPITPAVLPITSAGSVEMTGRATPVEMQTFMEDVVGALESIKERFTAIEARLDAIDAEEVASANEDLCISCPAPDNGMASSQVCVHRIGASLNAANRKALTDAVTLISAVLKNAGEPVAAATSAATPEPVVVPKEVRTEEVSFKDIDDIRAAMLNRRALSAAEDILSAMTLRVKSRS